MVSSSSCALTNSIFIARSLAPPRKNSSGRFLPSTCHSTHKNPSQYLEKLCDILYDDLRPRILHEPRLTALCEVCTVLQALMVLDSSAFIGSPDSTPADSDASGDDDDDVLTIDLDSAKSQRDQTKRKGRLGRLHISRLLQMVLQDAQTRLFFKAQAMIQSEIRHYVPKSEDLRWPELLIGALLDFSLRLILQANISCI